MFRKVKLKELITDMHQGVNTVADKVEYTTEGYPIIQSKNITKGFLDLDDIRFINKETYQKYKQKYNPKKDDLLVCNIGTIGKALLVEEEKDFVIAWNLFLIKVDKSKIDSKYLKFYFEYLQDKSFFDSLLTGGTVKFVNKSKMGDIEIPLTSLENQVKIAGILEKAQKIIQKRKTQILALSSLKQSTFIKMFGDPVNGEKWDVKSLGDFLDKIDSGWSPKSEAFPAEKGEKGVLKLSAVTKGVYRYQENKALYADTPLKMEMVVKAGDLLLTRKNTRELVGACSYVFDTPPNLMLPDTIFRLVFSLSSHNQIHPIFLWRLLNNYKFRKKVSALAEGSAGSMPNISKKNLMKLKIIVPDINLQREFAEIIKEIGRQEQLLSEGLLNLEKNLNSLMQRAFRGDLN